MIGPRGDRDWFDRPEFLLLWVVFACLVTSVGLLVLWAGLR